MFGNHDNTGRLVWYDRASSYEWFLDLGANPKIITDGSTQKIENLIATTVPYHCSKEQKSIWLDRGFAIRKQSGLPWLVLHHVPPKIGSNASGEESEAAALLTAYRADYFVAGHVHAYPCMSGHSWNQRLGEMRLLVPAQLLSAPFPNYITLGTNSGEIFWHTTCEI